MALTGRRVKGPEQFSLDVFSQATTLGAALDHLMGDLFGGCRNQIMRFKPQFRQKTGQGLFT